MSESDIANVRRQMKIKTGVVKRLWKEHNMYRQEAQQLKIKYDKLVADDGDEWHIKNAKKVQEEGEKMITDSETRLAKSVIELRELVVYARTVPAFKDGADGVGDADLTAAEAQLQEANV